jgi:hypothetical protein
MLSHHFLMPLLTHSGVICDLHQSMQFHSIISGRRKFEEIDIEMEVREFLEVVFNFSLGSGSSLDLLSGSFSEVGCASEEDWEQSPSSRASRASRSGRQGRESSQTGRRECSQDECGQSIGQMFRDDDSDCNDFGETQEPQTDVSAERSSKNEGISRRSSVIDESGVFQY